MNVDFVRSGDIALSQDRSGKQPAYLGHLTLSKDWNNEHLLIIGGSTYQENGSATTRLYAADITYRWAPAERRESHSFVAGGEFFSGKHTFTDTSSNEISQMPYGGFGYVQYQTSYWLYLGARYDWVKEPTNDQLITKAFSAYASYYTTEFLRFRIGFEHRVSDIPSQDNINSGFLDVNFVFGSHPTEPYWVNR